MTSRTKALIGPLISAAWPENQPNSVEDFIAYEKMKGVVHAQMDHRIGLLSSRVTCDQKVVQNYYTQHRKEVPLRNPFKSARVTNYSS